MFNFKTKQNKNKWIYLKSRFESKVNNVVSDAVIKCEHTFGERGHHGDKYYACIKCGEIK